MQELAICIYNLCFTKTSAPKGYFECRPDETRWGRHDTHNCENTVELNDKSIEPHPK